MLGGFVHPRRALPVRPLVISLPPHSVPVIVIRRQNPSLVPLQLLRNQGYPPDLVLQLPYPVGRRRIVPTGPGRPKGLLQPLPLPLPHPCLLPPRMTRW